MKYFILKGLIPELVEGAPIFGGQSVKGRKARIALWKETGLKLPKEGEQCFLRIKNVGRIAVFIHNVYDALLMIAARSQEKAYMLASPLRDFVSIYLALGSTEGNISEYLIELIGKPQPTQTSRQIAELYRQDIWTCIVDPDQIWLELGTGPVLRRDQLRQACDFVQIVHKSDSIAFALQHLARSHFLLSGYMTSSYYHYHYQHDRKAESSYLRRKLYLEKLTLYDMAFLSAFRAIEALLGTSTLKNHEIENRLTQLDKSFATAFTKKRWRSYHLFFSTGRKWWSIANLISLFLKTRNAVAAHANPKPPFTLENDQVFEIQHLAESMLFDLYLALSKKI